MVAGFGEQRADLASRRNGGADPASGGSCGLWMGSLGLFIGFFLFFNLIYRGGHETIWVEVMINRDLRFETVAKIVSVNDFCPPP